MGSCLRSNLRANSITKPLKKGRPEGRPTINATGVDDDNRFALMLLGGERGRNRTYNLVIKSHLLCQLSYAPGWVYWRLGGATRLPSMRRANSELYHPRSRGGLNRGRSNLRDVQQLGRRLAQRRQRVAEHRLAERAGRADHRRASSSQFLARSMFTRLPFSSPRNIWPPPAPQQNERSRARAGSATSSHRAITSRGSIVDIAVAAQVAGIVEDHFVPALCPLRQLRLQAGQQFAVMLNLERRAEFLPIRRRWCARNAGRWTPAWSPSLHSAVSMLASATCEKSRSLPRRRAGSPVHFSLRSTPKVTPRWRSTCDQRQHDLAALRIVRSHAAEPEAIFLRAVENRQLVFLDEFLPLARGKAQRVAVALHGQEHLRAVIVFPLASIHRAAAQPDNHRQMLDAHRTLKLASRRKWCTETPPPPRCACPAAALRCRVRLRSGNARSPRMISLGLSSFPVL